MKIIHTTGEHAGKLEDKTPEIARRLIVIGNAKVPTAEELASADEVKVKAEEPAAEEAPKKKASKGKK